MSDARLLTPKELADLWGCSTATIRRWIASGQIPVVDIAPPGSKTTKIRIREVDAVALTRRLRQGRLRRGAA